MRPPVRPPQLRCVFFSSMYLPHLLVLPATFWTSVPFATLSVFPSLICGSCPSGQRFAYSFFQIPSHGGHPCCSAMCFVVAYAHLGLSPIRKRPCWANKTGVRRSFSRPGACSYVTILPVSALLHTLLIAHPPDRSTPYRHFPMEYHTSYTKRGTGRPSTGDRVSPSCTAPIFL